MLYQFKIQLPGIDNPTVWRQVTVPDQYSFFYFSDVIKAAFGWEINELFLRFFDADEGLQSDIVHPEYIHTEQDAKDAYKLLLSDIFPFKGGRLAYDPGNGWRHYIVLEQIIDGKSLTAECIAGEGACPPGYCRTTAEYADMKRILSDREDPEYELTLSWLDLNEGETWEEVHKFDLEQTQQKVHEVYGGPEFFRNYNIVEHNTFDEEYDLTPELWELIDKLNIRVKQKKTGTIGQLEALVHKYPDMPHFKNMLASLFWTANKDSRFLEIEQQLLEDFPDYVLARCNLASYYSTNDQPEKALDLLGHELDLSRIYPERNGAFTETEIYNYHTTAAQCLIKVKDVIRAERHLDFINSITPNADIINALQIEILALRMEKVADRQREDSEELITYSCEVIPEMISPSDKSPVFTHPEVEVFYHEGEKIDRDIVSKILKLPRETLIEDMSKMIIDSIARNDYFHELPWDGSTHSFPVHALIVLAVLEAEEGLDSFFTILRQDNDYLEYWYSDLLTEVFWNFGYLMGQNRLDRFRDFILEPNRYTFARTAVSDIIKEVVQHQPHRKAEAIGWYKYVLKYMLDHLNDKRLIDSLVTSSLLNDFIDITDKEEWPFIMECYKTDLQLFEVYTFDQAKEQITKKDTYYSMQRGILSTADDFYDLLNSWNTTTPYNDYSPNDNYNTPYVAPTKPERNDPCPCGSGKKYKKCCGA